jgi:hypothetical protein
MSTQDILPIKTITSFSSQNPPIYESLNNYTKIKQIGFGGFSPVYLYQRNDNGLLF